MNPAKEEILRKLIDQLREILNDIEVDLEENRMDETEIDNAIGLCRTFTNEIVWGI